MATLLLYRRCSSAVGWLPYCRKNAALTPYLSLL